MKRTFDGEFIKEIRYDKSLGAVILVNKLIDHSRWSIDYSLVFQYESKFYSTCYSIGATECQENDWPESFECTEVEPFQETVTNYRPVLEEQSVEFGSGNYPSGSARHLARES